MAHVSEPDEVGLRRWLAGRPPKILALAKRFPPWVLFLLRSSNHRVVVAGYSEDNTLRVRVLGKYNFVAHEREVFGISPDDLEECDLPPPGEMLGAVLSQQEFAQALSAGKTPEERLAAVSRAAREKIAAGLPLAVTP